jgi:hypothetical protein
MKQAKKLCEAVALLAVAIENSWESAVLGMVKDGL